MTCEDIEEPECTENCFPGCVCIESYVKDSYLDDAVCVEEKQCKNIVDLTCGENELFVEEADDCALMCENVRLGTEKTNCESTRKFPGINTVSKLSRM
jgi:hypothetical protein